MSVVAKLFLLRNGGHSVHHISRLSSYHTLSGTQFSKVVTQQIKDEISSIKKNQPSFDPTLKIIQVGDRPDSSTYVRMKQKAATACNLTSDTEKLPADISQNELLQKISQINSDSNVHSVMIQLPLPGHLNEDIITNAIAPEKDVDGLTTINVGKLTKKNGNPYFMPCTPHGVIELLKHNNIELKGKLAVVIGRSDIVGVPISTLLRNENATVISCHSATVDVDTLVGMADIVVAACGVPEFVKGEWLKEGAVVVDVGINYVKDPTKKSGQRLVGDVDFESAKIKASFITPVPGGVGPMTVAMLMNNAFIAAKTQLEASEAPIKISPSPLAIVRGNIPSDFEIAKAQIPKDIGFLASELGIHSNELELFGKYKAKISHTVIDRLKERENGKYVLVAGITPTPLGEGKSTTTVGLVQALTAHLGKPSIATLRQPSMGPTFGVKGGAAGGGYSQVIPMDEFNLHMTGDIHAIGAANNLLAAAIDTRIFHEVTQKNDGKFYGRLVPKVKGKKTFTASMLRRLERLGINKTNPDDLTEAEIKQFVRLNINPDTISIKRVVDVNDRMLRRITIGEAPTEKGITRVTGFDITVASELMAILALSKDMRDMRERIGRMTVAFDYNGKPVSTEDIGCAGALTALLRDAIKPNMMQTLEGTPVLVHAGPFANISIGASSVIADLIALKLVGRSKNSKNEDGYVVTEAGFDFTMGGERFFDIKCRSSGLAPNVVVLVSTIRAIKSHGGAPNVKPGQALPEEYTTENTELVKNGVCNLIKQIENVKQYGVPVVVAINKFGTDTDAEIEIIKQAAKEAGASDAVVSTHFEDGGAGSVNLAKAVMKAADEKSNFKPLYDLNDSFEEKMGTIVKKLYNGKDISISEEANKKLKMIKEQGFGHLPVCVAKTQYSLSHDATLKGVPSDFIFPIRDVRLSTGGGYIQALANEIQTIPGLSTYSGYMNVEVNEKDEIEGLF